MKTIAILCDEEEYLEVLVAIIQSSGKYQTGRAFNKLRDLLRYLEHNSADIILMSLGFGGSSIKAVNKHAGASSIIVIASVFELSSLTDAFAAGATGYVLRGNELGAQPIKPFRNEYLN